MYNKLLDKASHCLKRSSTAMEGGNEVSPRKLYYDYSLKKQLESLRSQTVQLTLCCMIFFYFTNYITALMKNEKLINMNKNIIAAP